MYKCCKHKEELFCGNCVTKIVSCRYIFDSLQGLWILHVCFENSVNRAFLDRLQAGAMNQEQSGATQDGGCLLKQEPQEDAVFSPGGMHTNIKHEPGEPSKHQMPTSNTAQFSFSGFNTFVRTLSLTHVTNMWISKVDKSVLAFFILLICL